ncbi:MAG: sulfatase-like hydrolase/transferase [Thermoleophilaceae bacterium]
MRRAAVARLAALLAVLGVALIAPAPVSAASKRPPVVMIVLDEFPVADIMRPDGAIDGRRFPGFAALARGSTWFPNAHTVYDSTHEAVPAILDGRLPRPGRDASFRSHPRSIFTFMDRLGYRIRAREEVTAVCPPRLCRRADHYGKPEYNILHRRRERLESTIASLRRTKRPTFTFHHSVLPHGPWVYLPSGRARVGYRPGTLPDFASPAGFGDPFLTQHNEQRHLLQAGFVDREVGRLVRRLQRTRQWRRALVVVTADHGISFQVGSVDRRQVTEGNVQEVAPIPLFVKRPGQTRGSVSRAYARTVDVLPTVAHLLHARLGFPVDGRQAFGAAVGARTGIAIERRDLGGEIVVPAAEMEARRQADRDRRARVFGTGPWSRVYRIGPNRRLLGRRVPQPTGSHASVPPVARFAVPAPRTVVRRGARAVPTLAAGRLVGGTSTGGRDLALAVNGRIVSVGRSFRLAGDPVEWFSLDLPESGLRRGLNPMALYEVGTGTKLELIGVRR